MPRTTIPGWCGRSRDPQKFREIFEVLEAEKPRTTAQLAYLDDTGTQLSIVHVFADADTMDFHFEGA